MSETLAYTCTKDTAVVYKLRGKGFAWADITIREWPGGGSIDIQSDFGDYANIWNSIGSGPLRKFLCGLNMDYFLNKCLGNAYLEFDCKGTIQEIKRDIIRGRRDASIEHGVAREIWDSLAGTDTDSEYGMLSEMGEDAFDYMVGELYGHDRSMIPIATRPKCECVNFWKEVWPCACEVWCKELATDLENISMTFASVEELEVRFAGLNDNPSLQSEPCPICGQHGHIGDCEGD